MLTQSGSDNIKIQGIIVKIYKKRPHERGLQKAN